MEDKMKIIKKLISTVLALAIVFTFSSVAFAVEKESVEPLATCNHTWNAGYTEYICLLYTSPEGIRI